MIESIKPRIGLARPGQRAPTPTRSTATSGIPSKDSPDAERDLQYACIFPLPTPKDCTEPTDCDCFVPTGGNPAATQNPLCQNGNGHYSTTQIARQGYPGTRELQVLQGLGDQAIVASICPANVTDMTQPPTSATARPSPRSSAACATRSAAAACRASSRSSADGRVPCVILEAFNPAAGATCNCSDRPGRVAADPEMITPEIRGQGSCFCEINQLEEPDRTMCRDERHAPRHRQ